MEEREQSDVIAIVIVQDSTVPSTFFYGIHIRLKLSWKTIDQKKGIVVLSSVLQS